MARVRLLWPVISAPLVIWLGIYGVLASVFPEVMGRIPPAVRLTILVLSVVAIVAIPVVADIRRKPPASDLWFSMRDTEIERALVSELQLAEANSRATYWERSASEGFPTFFPFWWKYQGHPAYAVALQCDGDLNCSWYQGLPDELEVDKDSNPKPLDPKDLIRRKFVLANIEKDLSDQPFALRGYRMNYGMLSWVEDNELQFRAANPQVSLFGVTGWTPYPSLLAAACIVVTSDLWVLFCLRPQSPIVDYFPNTWSVSFEEQAQVSNNEPDRPPDRSLFEVATRGLKEEFGIAASQVDHAICLAVGREYSDIGRSIRNTMAVVLIRLALNWAEAKPIISNHRAQRDSRECAARMGCRFEGPADVLALINQVPVTNDSGIGPSVNKRIPTIEVELVKASQALSSGGYGWHPASRVRLEMLAKYLLERNEPFR